MKDPFSIEYGGVSGGRQGSIVDDLLEEKELTKNLNNTLGMISEIKKQLRSLEKDVVLYNEKLAQVRIAIVEKLEYVANKRIINDEEIKEDQ
jgi:hypothetical protein